MSGMFHLGHVPVQQQDEMMITLLVASTGVNLFVVVCLLIRDRLDAPLIEFGEQNDFIRCNTPR